VTVVPLRRPDRDLAASASTSLEVSPATRRTAILKVMADLGYLQVEAHLALPALMASWNTVGLRADDLAAGLNECLADGILKFSGGAHDSALWLSRDGKAWIDSAHAADEIARQKQILQAAQRRRVAQAGDHAVFFLDRRKS
jgi:hypothetical protein